MPRRVHEAQRQEAIRLRREEQLSTPVIARRVALSNYSVYRILKKYPWVPRGPRPVYRGKMWIERDRGTLRLLWATAEQSEILAALPGHSWEAIMKQASFMKLRRQSAAMRHNKRPLSPLVKKLRAAREEQKITRAELSRRLGFHVNQLLNWELGKARPLLPFAESWAEALGFVLTLSPRAGFKSEIAEAPSWKKMAGR